MPSRRPTSSESRLDSQVFHQNLLCLLKSPEAVFALFKKKSDMVSLLVLNSRQECADQPAIVPDIWSGLLAESQALAPFLGSDSPTAPAAKETGTSLQQQQQQPPQQLLKSALQTSSSPLTSDFLPPNSHSPSGPLPDKGEDLASVRPFLGSRLTQTDFARIDSFMSDFLAPRVIEAMLKNVRDWERDIASNRRGISARLLKVGLKYFGSQKASGSTGGPVSPTIDSNGLAMYDFFHPPKTLTAQPIPLSIV